MGEWFRCEIPKTLKKFLPSILITIVIGVIGVITGFTWLSTHLAKIEGKASSGDFSNILTSGLGLSPVSGIKLSFLFIWGHNLLAMAIIFLFGLFSFGILGVIIYILNMGIIGFALAFVRALGLSPISVGLAGILPHGIFELSALILTGAAILYTGAVLVTPRAKRTLGEVLIETFADCMRVGIGLVLPMLTIAAAIETWVTPVLLSSVLK